MAAATVDLEIDEGDTFIMTLEFWVNADGTIPMDISGDTFTGAFKIGTKFIPMTITTSSSVTNVIELRVDQTLMKDLSTKGRYDIDQLTNGDNFRLLQGAVRVSPEVVA